MLDYLGKENNWEQIRKQVETGHIPDILNGFLFVLFCNPLTYKIKGLYDGKITGSSYMGASEKRIHVKMTKK